MLPFGVAVIPVVFEVRGVSPWVSSQAHPEKGLPPFASDEDTALVSEHFLDVFLFKCDQVCFCDLLGCSSRSQHGPAQECFPIDMCIACSATPQEMVRPRATAGISCTVNHATRTSCQRLFPGLCGLIGTGTNCNACDCRRTYVCGWVSG